MSCLEQEQWKWYKEDKSADNEINCYSLIAGNVLCRYWGNVGKSKEASLIENAPKLLEILKIIRDRGDTYIGLCEVDELIRSCE